MEKNKSTIKKTVLIFLLVILTGHFLAAQKSGGRGNNTRYGNLANTTWLLEYTIDGRHTQIMITFLADNTFASEQDGREYSDPENERWQANRDGVVFSFNDEYSVYTGEFRGRNTIFGAAANQSGQEWEWTLTRQGSAGSKKSSKLKKK